MLPCGDLGDGDNLRAFAPRPAEHVVERRGNDLPGAIAETAHLVRRVGRDHYIDFQPMGGKDPFRPPNGERGIDVEDIYE